MKFRQSVDFFLSYKILTVWIVFRIRIHQVAESWKETVKQPYSTVVVHCTLYRAHTVLTVVLFFMRSTASLLFSITAARGI